MLTEGKSWKVLHVQIASHSPYSTCTYTVSGDTIVNGQTCKRILVKEKMYEYALAAYEENGKVYRRFDDVTALLMDFNKNEGDYFWEIFDGYQNTIDKVEKVDYVTVDGTLRKRIKFNNNVCWVEGIGSSEDNWPGLGEGTGFCEYLLECYDNGKLIFKQEDFGVPLSVSSITPNEKKNNQEIYSISGMRLKEAPGQGVYIRDGKKMVK